jgi:hypothetical protein
VSEAEKAIRIHLDDAGQLIVVTASHEANALDTVRVEFGRPAICLLLAGTGLCLRFGEIKGHPPLVPRVLELLLAKLLPLQRSGVLDPPGLPRPVPALARVALDREMRVNIDNVKILKHQLPPVLDRTISVPVVLVLGANRSSMGGEPEGIVHTRRAGLTGFARVV